MNININTNAIIDIRIINFLLFLYVSIGVLLKTMYTSANTNI